jgi:hypothetical protein
VSNWHKHFNEWLVAERSKATTCSERNTRGSNPIGDEISLPMLCAVKAGALINGVKSGYSQESSRAVGVVQ